MGWRTSERCHLGEHKVIYQDITYFYPRGQGLLRGREWYVHSSDMDVSCGRSRNTLRHMNMDHALSPSCYRKSQVKFVLIRLLADNNDSIWELLSSSYFLALLLFIHVYKAWSHSIEDIRNYSKLLFSSSLFWVHFFTSSKIIIIN